MTFDLKIYHDRSYILYHVDTHEQALSILDEASDLYLDNIFKDRGYRDLISWLSERMGGETDLSKIVEIIKHNNGRSVKDHVFMEITELYDE